MTENRNKRWDDNLARGELNWTDADKADLAEALQVPGVRTWRQRIGVGKDWPLHAPNDVERAMVAEIAELRLAAAKAEAPVTQQAAAPGALDAELVELLSEGVNMVAALADTHKAHDANTVRWLAAAGTLVDTLRSAPGTPEAPAYAHHPLQPLVEDTYGRVRFKRNAIVDHLATNKLNDLATMDFPAADWEQLAQLIGYSLEGFGALSYVTDETYDRAAAQPVLPRAAQLDGGQGEGK